MSALAPGPRNGPKLTGARCCCSACGELFNSVFAFDRHRRGVYSLDPATRYCLTPRQMHEAGWAQGVRGFWRTPASGRRTLAERDSSGDRARPATEVRP